MTSDLIFDLLIVMLFVSGLSLAAIGGYARRFVGRVPAATPFVLLMLCAAAWAFLYSLDLLTQSLPLRIFYHNLRFLYLPFFSVLELWLVLAYVNKTEWIRRDLAALVLIIPVLSAILAITSPYHTLFRYNFSLNTAGPVPVLQYSESLFYEIYFLYSFALLVLAIVLLIYETRKRGTLWETSTILLLIALAFPTALSYFAELSGLPYPGINPTPALLWIAAILYTIALFRYHFLDIIPIARGRLIEALSKPVLVLDTSDRVIDINPAACSLFSLAPAAAIGKKIDRVVQDWPDFLALCRERTARKRDLIRTLQDGTHYYIGSVEPLLSANGVPEGHLIFLQDITELKAAEASLHETEKRYRDMFELNNAVMLIIDPAAGTILEANEAACRYYGYTKEEFAGLNIAKINIQDPQVTRKDMAHAINSPGAIFRFRHRKKNGEIRDVEVFSAPVNLAGQRVLHSIIQDVTERKLAEEALRQSEEKYRILVESSFDGIAIHQDNLIVYINQTAARLLGSEDPAVFLGRPAIDVVAPAFRNAALLRVQQAPEKSLGLIREQFVRLDGSLIDVDVTTVPTIWMGKPAAYVTFRDITAQVRAENALRESEEKYRSIIDEMQDLFYRTDTSGRITMLSPSAFTISGYSVEDLIGQDVARVYADPHDREHLLAILREKGSVDSFPLNLRVRDGSIRHVTTSSHFYRDTTGNILGIEGVIHDITEQKRAEEALRIANKKLHLLSSITRHDIRNQLMALMAFIELSQDSIDKPEELIEFLKKNQKIAETITRQITFTKDYEDLGLNAPLWQDVNASIDAATAILPMRNIRVAKEIAGLEVFADPLMEKVFYNLIDNSLRYGGEKMTTIRIASRVEGPSLVLVFEDDGVGIPEQDKKVIFDKGFGQNTGLGLYLSREILAITGITIIENGTQGTGARFEMSVPKDGFRFTS